MKIYILACILLWACSLVSRALGAYSFSTLSPTIRLQYRLVCNYKAYLRLTFPQEKLLWVGVAKSVQRLATGWTVRGSNPGGRRDFPHHPDQPWSPPILLYNGYRASLPGVKRSGRGVDIPRHLEPRLKKEYSHTSTPPLGLHGL